MGLSMHSDRGSVAKIARLWKSPTSTGMNLDKEHTVNMSMSL